LILSPSGKSNHHGFLFVLLGAVFILICENVRHVGIMIDPRYNFIIGFNFVDRSVLSITLAAYAVHLSSDLSPSSHFIEK